MASDDIASPGTRPNEETPTLVPADLPGGVGRPDEDKGEPPRSDRGSIWPASAGVVASTIGHLIVVSWVVGSLATAQGDSPTEAIPVELVAAEVLPPPPPSPPSAASAPEKSEGTDPRQNSRANPVPSPEDLSKDQNPADTTPSREDARSASSSAKPLASLGMASGGRPTTLTQDELDSLVAQARRCWNAPTGWTDPRQVSVTVRFRLNRDGTLSGTPVVVEFPASKLGKTAADDAVRALLRCGPFSLPADKYDEWSDVQLRLAP